MHSAMRKTLISIYISVNKGPGQLALQLTRLTKLYVLFQSDDMRTLKARNIFFHPQQMLQKT